MKAERIPKVPDMSLGSILDTLAPKSRCRDMAHVCRSGIPQSGVSPRPLKSARH